MKNVAWTVTAANWTWVYSAPRDESMVELTTTAVENCWGINDKGELTITKGKKPKLGAVISIKHSEMPPEDETYFYSALILANAGLHAEAKKLQQAIDARQ